MNIYPSTKPLHTRHGHKAAQDHEGREADALKFRVDGDPGLGEDGRRVHDDGHASVVAAEGHQNEHDDETVAPWTVFNWN